jgi:hypothetical protein
VIRGIIRDSTSQLAIAGAVISTLDSAGRAGARVLSNERGVFRVFATSPAVRLRVVRLGFRPVELQIPRGGAEVEVNVAMTRIPYGLQPVRVTGGQRCPRRSDRAVALALFEQAQDGLLATVVARSSKGARMKRLTIERVHDGASERLRRHKVLIDTAANSIASYIAAHSAVDFVKDGFSTDSSEGVTFFAPDADVLLDDGFANGYCFHVMDRVQARPNQVGLGFRSADRKNGRIDVDGALWIDTVARALVDIEFRYVGLPAEVTRLNPGGRVSFREMPNGVVLIDRWMLRLVGSETDSASAATRVAAARPSNRRTAPPAQAIIRPTVTEAGGELARVAWPDGPVWRSDLGRLSLTMMHLDGTPLRATRVRLDDTDYEATTDSVGHLEIDDLAPGPYSVRIADSRADPIGLTVQTPVTFVAERGATATRTVRTQTLEDYVGGLCRKDGNADIGAAPPPGIAWIVGRVSDASGALPKGLVASAPYFRHVGAQAPSSESRTMVSKPASYRIGSDGLFAFCGLPRDTTITITVGRGNTSLGNVSYTTRDPLGVLPVDLQAVSRR